MSQVGFFMSERLQKLIKKYSRTIKFVSLSFSKMC